MFLETWEGYHHVYRVSGFSSEFDNLFKKNAGAKKRVEAFLLSRLTQLEHDGRHCHMLYEQFKHLTKTEPSLFEIRHPNSQLNERYLYIYYGACDVILLTVFLEKAGRSDYRSPIAKAYKIIKELEG